MTERIDLLQRLGKIDDKLALYSANAGDVWSASDPHPVLARVQ